MAGPTYTRQEFIRDAALLVIRGVAPDADAAVKQHVARLRELRPMNAYTAYIYGPKGYGADHYDRLSDMGRARLHREVAECVNSHRRATSRF